MRRASPLSFPLCERCVPSPAQTSDKGATANASPPQQPPSQAEQAIIQSKYDKEYLPITGFAEFTKQAALLAYGKDSAPLKEGRVSGRPVDPQRYN